MLKTRASSPRLRLGASFARFPPWCCELGNKDFGEDFGNVAGRRTRRCRSSAADEMGFENVVVAV